MKTQTLDYKYEGITLRGYLASPDGSERRPGVLIFHEAPGCDDHVKRRAGMLAELGYVALAVDMYGEGKVAGSGPEALAMMNEVKGDVPKFQGRLRAGYDALVARPNVNPQQLAAIGYCFGGYCVLELARSGAQLAGAVTFHGLLATENPAAPGKVKPKILVCTGAEDPLVPAAQVAGFEQEMTKVGVDWQVNIYSGAKHAFTNTAADQIPMPGFGYQPAADRRSWAAMRGLFSEVFV
ncbi:MAG TPA: dienelactone hydrolase family protein [Candidatus Binataceae bacterium]|nr:dienelactone hydrolase family protein [Candidatus Binataceae bacterium]